MNIAEILRKLADALDRVQSPAEPELDVSQSAQSCGDSESNDEPEMGITPKGPEGDQKTWMPPQTQEMELLKKVANVPSEFDHENGNGGGNDEIDNLKRLAGIISNKP